MLDAMIIGLPYNDEMSYFLSRSISIDTIRNSTTVHPRNYDKYDLYVFTGGDDVTPELYGEQNTYSNNNVQRDMHDVFFLRYAEKMGKKIFGVCRGHQLINAYFGGKLYQDICASTGLNQHRGIHKLRSELYPFSHIAVNSTHHQGVYIPGDGFKVLAHSPYGEGVIEATRRGNQVLSFQFHPEFESFPGNSFAPIMTYFNKFLDSNIYDYSEGA